MNVFYARLSVFLHVCPYVRMSVCMFPYQQVCTYPTQPVYPVRCVASVLSSLWIGSLRRDVPEMRLQAVHLKHTVCHYRCCCCSQHITWQHDAPCRTEPRNITSHHIASHRIARRIAPRHAHTHTLTHTHTHTHTLTHTHMLALAWAQRGHPGAVRNSADSRGAILYCTILYYTILYYTILYYTTLYYYTILYYTIIYYTVLL